jgi:hypothetical protein
MPRRDKLDRCECSKCGRSWPTVAGFDRHIRACRGPIRQDDELEADDQADVDLLEAA